MLNRANTTLLALLLRLTTCIPFVSKRSVTPPVSNTHISLNQSQKLDTRDTGLTGGPHYYGDFNLGGTAIQAVVDTGSTDLAILQSVAPAGSYSDVSGSCSESYGGRAALNGQIATGNYHFANYDVGGRFCLISSGLSQQAVMGLGFIPSSGNGVAHQFGDGPLYQFAERGLTGFAIYLATQPGGGGVFTVNGQNPAYKDPSDNWIYESREQGQPHWAFPLAGGYEIGDGASQQWGATLASVDSGTPYIVVPPATASAIWQAVGANSDGTYNNCNPGGSPIHFASAGGNGFVIEAVHYIVYSGGGCRNAFQPSKNAQRQIITLGTPFMKQYYTYFDYNNQEIGFVKSSG